MQFLDTTFFITYQYCPCV